MGTRTRLDSRDDDETERLLKTLPPDTAGYDGRSVGEDDASYKRRWRSIRVMYLTMFLSSVSFSICMSSLYPYLQILDPKASTNLLGWVVAAYSLGQLAASPFFGAWSNWRKNSREPLIASLVINVLANVLYVYLQSVPKDKTLLMIITRIGIGFGAGNVAVVRSYMSAVTTMDERTPAMANVSAFQAVGFIIGPVIQTAMVPLGFPGPLESTAFHLDLYTAPAVFSALLGILNIVLLVCIFKELADGTPYTSIQDGDNEGEELGKPDLLATLSSIGLFFSILFVFAVFETIATPVSMHMFSWSKAHATLYIGFMLGGAGVVSIAVFVVIKKCSKVINERYLLLIGFVFCLLGFFTYLPWGSSYPDIQYADIVPPASSHAAPNEPTHQLVAMTTSTARMVNTTSEPLGCPYTYHWCLTTPRVYLWQFILGTFFVAIGYPTCNVMSYTIYSKILGPKPQGVWMGWLTAAGSLARTLGPIFVTQVYDATGPRWTFFSVCVIVIASMAYLCCVFKRLIPFQSSKTLTVT